MMGSSPDSHSSVEENTHIGTLCDLLERIWGHGLKKRDVSLSLCFPGGEGTPGVNSGGQTPGGYAEDLQG